MRYNPLGRTGLFVSELCLGTMTFGGAAPSGRRSAAYSRATRNASSPGIDAGINFLDTADVYSRCVGADHRPGAAEPEDSTRQRDRRDQGIRRNGAGPNDRGATRHHILSGVQASLQRLQLDYIDLYQIHGFDPATPIEETLRALDQVVRQGDVRYVGVSNWAAWQIVKALGISERLGLTASIHCRRITASRARPGTRARSDDAQ